MLWATAESARVMYFNLSTISRGCLVIGKLFERKTRLASDNYNCRLISSHLSTQLCGSIIDVTTTNVDVIDFDMLSFAQGKCLA